MEWNGISESGVGWDMHVEKRMLIGKDIVRRSLGDGMPIWASKCSEESGRSLALLSSITENGLAFKPPKR